MNKIRLDVLMVEQGICESRTKAQALILAGEVLVDDSPVDKAGTLVGNDVTIRLRNLPCPFVSRGGMKLAKALDEWDINVDGLSCLDAGSSTGGFTDCLLQHNAAKVVAVDVGTNQLHWKLRNDPRVLSIENFNLRYWQRSHHEIPFDFLCADLSFISLRLVIPSLIPSLRSGAKAVLLIKPQFEAGKDAVGEGGIVRDTKIHEIVKQELFDFFQGTLLKPLAIIPSPILGQKGNQEFLMYLQND